MVKRRLKYTALLLAGVFAIIAALGGFIIYTEQGTSWLFRQLLAQAPETVRFAESEGRLADRLTIRDLEINWTGGSLGIEEVELAWSFWALPMQRLDIETLTLNKPVLRLVKDKAATEQPRKPIEWPELPLWLQPWQVDITRLSVNEAAYLRAEGESLALAAAESAIKLDDGQLVVPNLKAATKDHTATAAVTLNLFAPGASGDLSLVSVQTGERLVLSFDLQDTSSAHLLKGPFRGRVAAKDWPEHLFNGELTLNRSGLAVNDLVISNAKHTGQLSGRLELNWADKITLSSLVEVTKWPVELAQDMLVLDGTLSAAGPLDSLGGRLKLEASGPRLLTGSLSGDFHLGPNQARLDLSQGTWLGSRLTGSVETPWPQPEEIVADLRIQGLDPTHFDQDWSGLVNLDGAVMVTELDRVPRVDFDARLTDSRLRGLPLTGIARGHWQGHSLSLDEARFSGDGFTLAANGTLDEKLLLEIDISNLGGLLPQTQGQVRSRGWLRHLDNSWSGELTASGSGLTYDRLNVAAIKLAIERPEGNQPAALQIAAEGLTYGTVSLDEVMAELHGDLETHNATISLRTPTSKLLSSLNGSKSADRWEETITSLVIEHTEFGEWTLKTPVLAILDPARYSLDNLALTGRNGQLIVSGGMRRDGTPERLQLRLADIPLALTSSLLGPLSLTGKLDLRLNCDELSCDLEASGIEAAAYQERHIAFDKVRLAGRWDQSGLQAALDIAMPDKASLSGQMSSKAAYLSSEPFPLQWQFDWQDFPLAAPGTLPERVNLTGTWQGHAQGVMRDRSQLSAELQATLNNTSVSWDDEDSGTIEFIVDEAVLEGLWQENKMTGTASLVMQERGQLSASWDLPIPARLPIEPVKTGKVSGHLGGWMTEEGLVGILWPELFQETEGDIEIDTRLQGTWQAPHITGEAFLKDAHAYVPAAGITLDPVELAVQFDEQQVKIAQFSARSEPGALSATGSVDLQGWRPTHIDLKLLGQDFTLINIPELQVRVNPDLRLTGAGDKLQLSGDILIPSFLAAGRSERSPVQVSPDVVIVGQQTKRNGAELPFKLDSRIKLILGDQVLVKMFGLDARLGGQLELTGIDRKNFKGAGAIEVLEGSFSTYGIKLGIDKGRAIYANGPLDNPALDILALKTIGETKAGVKVRGTAKAPEVKLYSEPDMPDTDILSLVVLGRPLNQASGETDPLMLAAGALLSAGDSAVLRNQLQNQLGLDSITAESETGETTDTILRLGKYLTPDLYLSYGYALMGQRSEVSLRYRIHEGWEAESNFGLESGADIFYRFEFD